MSKVVVQFPKGQQVRTPLAQFFRIGDSHRKFAEMHAAGGLSTSRVVFDAGRLTHQTALLKELRSEGIEITIDTGAAELSSPARYQTFVRNAPWLKEKPSAPLGPDNFNETLTERLAEMVITAGADRVLAPAHFLGDPRFDAWMQRDAVVCANLRDALDRSGGSHVRIDYPVIQSVQGLLDPLTRRALAETLSILPVDIIWMRLSGLGKEPGPQKIRSLIRMLSGFHNLGKPVILDYCTGLNAEAAEAFGVASGFAGGILELDQFNARDWHKPPKEPEPDAKFARPKIVQVPGLGRGFYVPEFELLARARGGRKLLLENDYVRAASIDDMVRDRKRYQALYLTRSQEALQAVPDHNRAVHFLTQTVSKAERRAKDVSFLKPTEAQATAAGVSLESLLKRTRTHAETMGKVADALEKLQEERGTDTPPVRACDFNVDVAMRRGDQR